MSKLKLAIIGASYLQLPLVEKAKKMDLYTICFAWEKGAVCKDICDEFYPISIIDKERILEICKYKKIDAVLSIASDVAVHTVNYIASKLGLIGNSIESSILSTNKYLMRDAFKRKELPIPWYFETDQNYDLNDFLDLKYPIIIKPVDRSGSKGITVLNSSKGLKKALDYALKTSFSNKVIIEEFIIGEEISVESISYKGKHQIITFTDKKTSGYPHFVELEHHQPSKYFDSFLNSEICRIVKKGLDSLKIINGASHSELIITDNNKIYITEIGARMGGDFIGSHLVHLSTGYDYLKSVINLSLGNFTEFVKSDNSFSGIYFYSAKTRNIKGAIKKLKKEIVQFEFEKELNDKLEQSSDRSGYFIYQSDKKIIV